jgi:hypothetical protein
MKSSVRFLLSCLASCLLASVSFAGVITGTITNGTTGKPAADVQVILFQLQGGMQQAATTKTDASGHYKLESPALGGGPMLLRAIYRGVNYHEPVTPDKTSIDIQVFEPTDKSDAFAVTAHAIILQPSGAELTVGEEYNIQNSTQPPMAFFRADGSFVFALPDGAELNDVSAVGSQGMPVKQAPLDRGKDQHAIAFPFRPGTSGVRLAYHMPYPNDKATLRFTSPYAAKRLAIFAPPTVTVSGDGFAPAGQDQGFNVYLRESVAANTPVTVSVSGTAPAFTPDSGAGSGAGAGGGAGDDSQNPAVNSRAESGATAPTGSFTAMPARLDSLQWILVAGFGVLFILGAIFLWRQPVGSVATATVGAPAAQAMAPARMPEPPPVIIPPARPAAQPGDAAVANLEQQIRGGLDELKDMLFRLELRREAGTISAEDYARDRERVQKVLRDLVKG